MKKAFIFLLGYVPVCLGSCGFFEKRSDVTVEAEMGPDSLPANAIQSTGEMLVQRVKRCLHIKEELIRAEGFSGKKFRFTVKDIGSDSASLEQLKNIVSFPGEGIGYYETYDFSEIAQGFVDLDKWLIENKPKAAPKAPAPSHKPQSHLDSLLVSDTVVREPGPGSVLFPLIIPNVDEFNSPRQQTSCIGYAKATDTALVNEYLQKGTAFFPLGIRFLWSRKPGRYLPEPAYELHAIRSKGKEAFITANDIGAAQVENSEFMSKPVISVNMNKFGANKWEEMTRESLHHCIAITFDGKVLCAPAIQGVISTGASQVKGDFTRDELNHILHLLYCIKLPARVRTVSLSAR